MTYGIRTGSILHENMRANAPQKSTNIWMSRRKKLCWSCQKEKPSDAGVLSFAGGKTDGTRGSLMANSVTRWICFECKAAKAEKAATSPTA